MYDTDTTAADTASWATARVALAAQLGGHEAYWARVTARRVAAENEAGQATLAELRRRMGTVR